MAAILLGMFLVAGPHAGDRYRGAELLSGPDVFVSMADGAGRWSYRGRAMCEDGERLRGELGACCVADAGRERMGPGGAPDLIATDRMLSGLGGR